MPLSPLHSVEIAEAYAHLLAKPTERDYPLHTVAKKIAPDGRPLVHSELVIAGWRTRESFPLAAKYPVHFLKSYHPWTLHGDPGVEFENSRAAAEILGSPPPIGYDANSFRSTFVPGRPLAKLSPFTGVEPPERCLPLARTAGPAALVGLWRLAEEVFAQLGKLHARGYAHGDMELHNVIVCLAPARAFLIDFESATRDFVGPREQWEAQVARDLAEPLRLAVLLQCGLGRQEGPLAEAALEALPRLFRHPSPLLASLDAADRGEAG
ncbi:MAG: hypothetical protein JO117_10165 [Verrucomicrobia bacterium]|nr:hypothetical protein [Verrucomicrobiota bacterium]